MPASSPSSPTRTTIPASVRHLVVLIATLGAVIALGGLAPANAASTAIWTGGGTDSNWGNSANWSTGHVPGTADTAIIQEIPGDLVHVDLPGATTVASLQVLGGANHDVRVGDSGVGSLTVTGSMSWTGGDIGVPLTIPSGSTLTIGTGHEKHFNPDTTPGGQITVGGRVVVDNTGTGTDDEVMFDWDSGLTIAAGGELVSHGTSQLSGNRCCGADFPSAVDSAGTIAVPDGHLTVSTMGLYNTGTVDVAHGATLTDDKGLARLGDGTYSGGGRLELTNTEGPGPQPDHLDRNQGGALLLGTGRLSDGFEVVFGDDAEVTGVGGFTGTGVVEVDGATVYAKAALGGSVHLEVPAGSHSWLSVWNESTGYHGDVTLARGGTLEPSGHLTVDRATRLTIAGGSLEVGQQAMLDSSSCCTDTPEIVIGRNGTLDFHGDSAASPATMKWLTVTNAGTLLPAVHAAWISDTITQAGGTTQIHNGMVVDRTDFTVRGGTVTGAGVYPGDLVNTGGTVRPSGPLKIDGDYAQGGRGTLAVKVGAHPGAFAVTGTATLAGTLTATETGSVHAGRTQKVLGAGSVSGRFGCARTGRWVPTYSGTAVRLTKIGVATGGCLHSVGPKTVLSKTLKSKAVSFKAAFGTHAKTVLVQVKVKKATKSGKVRIWTGGHRKATVKVKRGKKMTAYVVVRVGKSHKLKARASAGKVKLTVRQYGWSN